METKHICIKGFFENNSDVQYDSLVSFFSVAALCLIHAIPWKESGPNPRHDVFQLPLSVPYHVHQTL